VPIVQEAGWAPGPVWTGAENLAPTGIFFNDTFVGPHLIEYNVTVLFDDVSVFFPTSLQVVLCMSVWSGLQFQTYVLLRFGVFPCGSAVSLLFSIAPLGEGVATVMCPDSSLLFSVGVECGMPSSERASYSPHSRWETVGFGAVCGNIPYVRVSIGWPHAAEGGGGAEVELWVDSPVWWNVSRVYSEDL